MENHTISDRNSRRKHITLDQFSKSRTRHLQGFGVTISAVGASRILGVIIVIVVVIFIIVAVVALRILFVIQSATK